MSGAAPDRLTALRRRTEEIRQRIEAAGGDPTRVGVVAVTKGFGPEAVALARAAGLADLGENYAQELLAKALHPVATDPTAGPPPRWHAIGRLQRNKVRLVAPHVTLWESLDRPELVDEVARRAPEAAALIQVNVSEEPQKGGCRPDQAAGLVARARAAGLEVRGLMAIGAPGGSEAARPGFALLRRLADELELPERSMGMSADLEAAVAEGATLIRVGTALFGPRR